MCNCCCGQHQYYSPYQYYGMTYGYPYAGYGYAYYGIPLGYAYTNPCAPVATYATAPAVYPTAVATVAPQPARGEYRVGNCLMICQ